MAMANAFIFVCRNGIAINHVVVITLYRYALIVHPRVYRVLAKTPVLVVAVSAIFVVPVVTITCVDTSIYGDSYVFITKGMYAMEEKNGTLTVMNVTNLVAIILYILFNGGVMGLCYGHIYIFIKRSARKVGTWKRQNTTNGTNGAGTARPADTKCYPERSRTNQQAKRHPQEPPRDEVHQDDDHHIPHVYCLVFCDADDVRGGH